MPSRLGQHFLIHPRPARTAVEALELRTGDRVVEIGPGKGALTFPLLEAAQTAGAKLTLIERDKGLAAELRALLHDANIKIIEDDAVRELPDLLRRARGRVKIAGNIPYYITGKLLRVFGDAPRPPERAVLMVQKEVAERIAARAPKFNLLAAAVQFWATPTIIAVLPPRDFRPPPKVASALILLKRQTPRPKQDRELYYKTLRNVFRQPRKTVLNNVREASDMSRGEAENLLTRLRLPSDIRPQNLSPEVILHIARAIEKRRVYLRM